MPGSLFAWYSLYDLDALADRGVVLSGRIELRQLTRLREILHSDRGVIQANLKFNRHTDSSVTVDLTFETVLELICQRCLEPLVEQFSERSTLTLSAPGAIASEAAKEEIEAVILTDERLNPAALIEDELIMSLPNIPRHAEVDECGSLAQSLKALAPDEWSGVGDPALRNN